MLLEDIKHYLNQNQLTIKENNYEHIFKLYQSNEAYAKISKNYPVTLDQVVGDVNDLPPSTDPSQKIFISIYNNQNELLAVMDLIDGYGYQTQNKDKTVWVGLLEIDQNKHSMGLGSLMMQAIEDACQKNQRSILQLGVIKENTQALNFWKKVGFDVFEEKHTEDYDLYLMEKILA